MLDEASSFLTTFNTEIGRFRYTVMPFGITVASNVFQCQYGWEYDSWQEGEAQRPWHSIDHPTRNTKRVQCKTQFWQATVQENRSGHSLAKHIQQMVTSFPRVKCLQLSKCQHQPEKQVQSFAGMVNYLLKWEILSKIVRAWRAH